MCTCTQIGHRDNPQTELQQLHCAGLNLSVSLHILFLRLLVVSGDYLNLVNVFHLLL